LRDEWGKRLDPAEQSGLMSWAAFTIVFAGLRILTHWIRGGHGPTGGGISFGGRHFHHYNIGIALLAAVGVVGLRGSEKQRRHPVVAIAYGSAAALVVDELALLLDLEDVYWASDGRKAWMLRSASSRQEPRSSPDSRSGRTRTVPYDPAADRPTSRPLPASGSSTRVGRRS
jgi:hypothetical protein